jgi:hypothetical protein
MLYTLPAPLQKRESLCRYLWKEMEPGVILYINRSVEDDRFPCPRGYVRMHVK